MAAGFEKHQKHTRRAEFLQQMEILVPWRELCAEIEPFYPKAGNGRLPVGLEPMLRMYLLQQWFNLADPAVEDALYDSNACAISWASTWAASPCRTRRQYASSAICWRSTGWARRFSRA